MRYFLLVGLLAFTGMAAAQTPSPQAPSNPEPQQAPRDKYAQTIAALDLGFAPVMPNQPLPDWVPLGDIPGLTMTIGPVTVAPGDTVDKLIANAGLRPDDHSRFLVSLLNTGLLDNPILQPGTQIFMPTLTRPADPASPYAATKQLAVIANMSEREGASEIVDKFSALSSTLNTKPADDPVRARLGNAISSLTSTYGKLGSGRHVYSSGQLAEVNISLNSAFMDVDRAVTSPNSAPHMDTALFSLRQANQTIQNVRPLPTAPNPVQPHTDRSRCSGAQRCVTVTVHAPANNDFCQILIGLPFLVNANSQKRAVPVNQPIVLLASAVEVDLYRGGAIDASSAPQRVWKDDIDKNNPVSVDIVTTAGCKS